jgi:hypothetical protein
VSVGVGGPSVGVTVGVKTTVGVNARFGVAEPTGVRLPAGAVTIRDVGLPNEYVPAVGVPYRDDVRTLAVAVRRGRLTVGVGALSETEVEAHAATQRAAATVDAISFHLLITSPSPGFVEEEQRMYQPGHV